MPRLTQTLKAVWLVRELGSAAAAEKVHSAVVRLREDHKSGARALAGIALDAFRDVLVELLPPLSSGTLAPGQEPEDAWLGRAKRVAWTLWKHGRPSMDSAIVHVLVAALRSVEELVQSGDRLGKGALDSIEALQSQRRGTARSISTQFIRYAQELVAIKASGEQGPVSNQRVMPQITILTLSSSGTILESLQTLAQALSSYPEQPKIIEIRVLESRPLFEGADMAAALLRHSRENGLTNLKVTVYPDAAIALAARGVDMLLLGADRIGETGEVSNKLGSLSAAIVTKDVCPTARVVVLSESEKIALPGRAEEHLVEENDPGEVIKSWSKETQATFTEELDEERRDIRRDTRAHVGVRNVYFEWIPAKLIDAYISENGELKVGDIKAHSISLLDSVSKLIPQHEG